MTFAKFDEHATFRKWRTKNMNLSVKKDVFQGIFYLSVKLSSNNRKINTF